MFVFSCWRNINSLQDSFPQNPPTPAPSSSPQAEFGLT